MSYNEQMTAVVAYLITLQDRFEMKLKMTYPVDHRLVLINNLPVFEKWQSAEVTGPDSLFLFHTIRFTRRLIKTENELNEIVKQVKELTNEKSG